MIHATHDCRVLDNTHAEIPDDVVSLWWRWRCPTCGQKWTVKEHGHGSRSAEGRGRASRRWRRQARKRSTISSVLPKEQAMTPTPEQLAAVLTKALKACHATENPQPEFRTTTDTHWHFGDDLYCEDCRPLNDEEEAIARGDRTLPPPAKGTHESDLSSSGVITHSGRSLRGEDRIHGRGGYWEFEDAAAWSRSR